MKKIKTCLIGFCILTIGCHSRNQNTNTALGLKDYYKEFFTMGVAVSPRSLKDSSKFITEQHFRSVTAENIMKMGPIHPKEDSFSWRYADELIDFAKERNLKVRGHALCWHNQTPEWFFVDDEGKDVSREVLLSRLETHITEVVTRYKDDVYAWDVVNEAISDDENEFYRNSKFYQIIGEDFIPKAFEYARNADPEAILFYNDYSVVNPIKRKKIYELIRKMKTNGVPIDGIGIQAHWSIYQPTATIIQETIDQFENLNIDIQITELDVSVYENSPRREKREDEIDDFTDQMRKMQIEKYDTIFQVFRKNKDKISGVTFWNVSDKYSWLDNFPVKGRKNYPLLFDEKFQPKEAYYKVIFFN
ncbi:MAG: endo-1,4-beta-xylanase [Reichenbachiella sp.]